MYEGIPRSFAARARACAWFPELCVTTPLAACSSCDKNADRGGGALSEDYSCRNGCAACDTSFVEALCGVSALLRLSGHRARCPAKMLQLKISRMLEARKHRIVQLEAAHMIPL